MRGRAAENCRRSGALEHPYPVANYGFDIHIDTGITRVKSNLLMAVQTIASFVWLGLLYLVKGALLLLQWGFSVDLLGDAMRDVRRALTRLHEHVIGEPWFLAAISVAGLWGIWRGFVQRRAIETIGGLFATVALMVVALVLISNPTGTVGRASRMTNDASLALLAGASTGSLEGGEGALSGSLTRVYDTVVLRPWCALEFGDIGFCLGRPPADVPEELAGRAGAARSVADLWLRFPAGGDEREQLYERWKGDGKPTQAKVRMQKEGSTSTRLALLALIAIGLLGAIALLGWLGFKLLMYAVLALILLLFAPAMLLAPAFGDSGRATFIAWGKRLLAAIVAKAIYALLLALVLVAGGVLAEMRSLGWFAVWLLQIVFWWTLFLKRGEIVGWLTVGGLPIRQEGGVPGAMRWYYNARAAGWGLRRLRRGADAIGGAPARALGRRGAEHVEAGRQGVQTAARAELDERADETLLSELAGARGTLARSEVLDRELRDVNRGLAKYDTNVQAAKWTGKAEPTPTEKESALLGRRDLLEASKDAPETIRRARSIVGAADRNLALRGREFGDSDRAALIEQRRRDIEAGLAPSHERSLRFAGVDPDAYGRGDPSERDRMEERARLAIERDRKLLAAVPPRAGAPPSRGELRQARGQLATHEVRERIREQHEINRGERRRRRVRERVYRRR